MQRALLVLEQQGGENFFGEQALKIADLMRTSTDGRGIISVLAADQLMQSPRLYATFLLWMLSELFEELPEVGDADKPKLVFFFDEAHLLFDDAPKALIDKVEQVVKLVRSKGVGVYFVTQNPIDIPDSVLSQLSNRVQHALRAYTPRDQKARARGGGNASAQSGVRDRGGDHAARRGRSAGVGARGRRAFPRSSSARSFVPPSARVGHDHPGGAQGGDGRSRPSGRLRQGRGSRVCLRGADQAGQEADRGRGGQASGGSASTCAAAPALRGRELPLGSAARARRQRSAAGSGAPRAATAVAEAAMKSAARSMATQLGRAIVRGILGSLSRGR